MHKSLVLVLGLGLGLLSACNDAAPEGQVIATVNGQEITRQQLNTAMRSLNIPTSTNAKDAQNAVLEQLVAKQLIVQAAKQDGLDKTQSFIEAIQNANDTLLISLYVKKIASTSRAPFDGDVSKFVSNNPSRFAQRQILTVEQIRAPAAAIDPSWVKNASNLDQIAAALTAHRVPFDRGSAQLDTATIERPDFEKILKLRPGEPFAVKQGPLALYSTVVGAKRAPIPDLAARDTARDYLRKMAGQQAVENRLKVLRADAKVQYQNGFSAPPAATSALAAATATEAVPASEP